MSQFGSLPTNEVRSILPLAIASSSSDFRPQMRMAMASFVQPNFNREFPPLLGTLTLAADNFTDIARTGPPAA